MRHGLVKSNYIPNRDQRELRKITLYRQELIEERARELNRIQSVLEGANIKLGSIISDINGKSGISILKAIISGNTDPVSLSKLACGTARNKIPELQKALKGSVKDHQIIMLRHQLDHVENLTKIISELDEDIQKKTKINLEQIQFIDEIPGIGVRSDERILAETGVNMEQFKNSDHFSSWAGLVPECIESAGKKMSTRIRKGNKYLKATLVECARSAIRKKDSYFYGKYQQIAARRGGKRALIAIAHISYFERT